MEYDDTLTRRFVERITVVDTETIQVKIRDTDGFQGKNAPLRRKKARTLGVLTGFKQALARLCRVNALGYVEDFLA
ncbi:hypothetical protein [Pseudoflavonifractor sp. 524-17]|uniref:hypothetical protein n=1 Tax=Pseudoflavonifractor sp. 524-17 TaxID=2304577 RepID=UPI0013793C75|nr:hypothetical protein [Pseudoflavonifractor sp. 524-17]